MKALSIRQPWAHLIIHAGKDTLAFKLAGEATDMADFYVRDKYLTALDTIASWTACQAQMMNRMAAILEKEKACPPAH